MDLDCRILGVLANTFRREMFSTMLRPPVHVHVVITWPGGLYFNGELAQLRG